MKLKTTTRSSEPKKQSKRIRREGNIPAIIYSEGKEGETIIIDGCDFSTALRHIKQGHLPTTVFTLCDASGVETKAIVKDIQYHTTTYNILHLDFERLIDTVPVKVKVPIELIGAEECAGVKLGGTLRQILRHLPVSCLPKDIPSELSLDITDVELLESKRLNALSIPEGVKPLFNLNEVAAIVAKR
jgi:large subunit ribosomal protein L25